MYRIPVFVLLLALFAASCGDDADVDASAGPGDSGTRPSIAGDWIVQSLTVDGDAIVLPDDELEITIELGEVRGTLGCNSFFGQIDAADDGTLTIGDDLGQTEMACVDEGRMEFEAVYGQALSSMTAWAVSPTALTLSGATAEIVYGQAPPPVHLPLEATVWTFDSIYEGAAVTNRADMEGVTVVIVNGEVTIDAPSCTSPMRLAAQYSGERDGPWVPEPGEGGGVVVECGEDDDIVSIAYRKLQSSTGFMINEERLTFIGEAGETVGFSAAPSE